MVRIIPGDEVGINLAAAAIRQGNLVAIPTETVYGLAADACNIEAIRNIYRVKQRPLNNPLIVHIASIVDLEKWSIEVPEYALKLAEEFWPGPLTLVLHRSKLVSDLITGNQDYVAVRVPKNETTLKLLKILKNDGIQGLVAPSANRFQEVSPTSAQDVLDSLGEFLGDDDLILDGGICSVGIESTIIDCTGVSPKILRYGYISQKNINDSLHRSTRIFLSNRAEETSDIPLIQVPGMNQKHYSPKAEVHLTGNPKKGDGFIALSTVMTPTGAVRLASPANLDEYAYLLYRALRSGDKLGIKRIFAVPPIGEGLAEAIRDRLNRAAHTP
jgi:L-threonylcarbamoyladenylate synthase